MKLGLGKPHLGCLKKYPTSTAGLHKLCLTMPSFLFYILFFSKIYPSMAHCLNAWFQFFFCQNMENKHVENQIYFIKKKFIRNNKKYELRHIQDIHHAGRPRKFETMTNYFLPKFVLLLNICLNNKSASLFSRINKPFPMFRQNIFFLTPFNLSKRPDVYFGQPILEYYG